MRKCVDRPCFWPRRRTRARARLDQRISGQRISGGWCSHGTEEPRQARREQREEPTTRPGGQLAWLSWNTRGCPQIFQHVPRSSPALRSTLLVYVGGVWVLCAGIVLHMHFPRFLLSSSSSACGLLELEPPRSLIAFYTIDHTAARNMQYHWYCSLEFGNLSYIAAPPCKDEIIQHLRLRLCFRSESFAAHHQYSSILCDKDDVLVVLGGALSPCTPPLEPVRCSGLRMLEPEPAWSRHRSRSRFRRPEERPPSTAAAGAAVPAIGWAPGTCPFFV
jgi:hypothetical protein